nr:sensor domain-containing diguanylate cyclase [Neptuniibacter halophilus]
MYQNELIRHLKGETEFFDCEYRVRNSQGGYVWVLAHGLALRNEHGVAYRMVGSIGDITERKDYENRLIHQASYDFLTGLPNRVLAMERLEQALNRARQKGTRVGVLFVDLDNFKKINDTLGHEVGDRHLKEVSQRLNQCMKAGEMIARLGGDEFLVILPDLKVEAEELPGCERILDVAAKPVLVEGYEFVTTASIGITLFPSDGEDPGALLRNADAAMYHAKGSGKNAYRYFTPEMEREAVCNVSVDDPELRWNRLRGQLRVSYAHTEISR